MATDLTAGESEYGFFFSTPADGPRVPDGFRDLTVPGLPVEQIWFFRLNVVNPTDATTSEHILLHEHVAPLAPVLCDAVVESDQAAFPNGTATCVINDIED